MSNVENIFQATKKLLKANNITYQKLANELELSEASIKKMFSEKRMSLDRLNKIADLMNLSLGDIIKFSEKKNGPSHISREQEQALLDDNKLFVVFQLLIKKWSKQDIQKEYNFDDQSLSRLFFKLQKLKLIEILPKDKVKLLVSNDFEWLEDGPVVNSFAKFVQKDFFNHSFDSLQESRSFLVRELSEETIHLIQRRISRFMGELDELAALDSSLEKKKLVSYGFLLGFRPWVFPLMKKYRKY